MGTKISALPTGTVAGTDEFPVVKAGVTTGVTFAHTHPESEITNLVTDLAGKASTTHTHSESDVTNLVTDLATLQSSVSTLQSQVVTLQSQVLGMPARTALDQSSWSWVNQGGASITQGSNIVLLTAPNSATENLRLRVVTAPLTAYKFAAMIVGNPMFELSFVHFGICLRESATGKVISVFKRAEASATNTIHMRKNNSETSAASSVTTNPIAHGFMPTYLQVGDNLTNVTCEYSFDGVNYTSILNEARGTFFTTGPDQVGIVALNLGSGQTQSASYLSWVRTV